MTNHSTMHRRRFFAGCILATSVGMWCVRGTLFPGGDLENKPHLFRPTLAMLTKNDFDPCLGSAFHLELGSGNTASIELINVSGFSERSMRDGATREPFSLVFRGAKELNIGQQIFKVSHPDLGSHEIFLVPLGADEHGMRLEAVFS